jgi:hypothetical protein
MYNKMKECSKCKIDKENIEFGISSRTKDGSNSWCKLCVRERSKQWYEGNKEKANKKSSKRSQDRRNWINEIKQQLKCIKCEENHIACLEFHHINPIEKKFEIGRAINQIGIEKEEILKEIKKCIILCSNCHKKFHYLERTEQYNIEKYLNSQVAGW